jgi:TPR repeat protein
MMKRVIAAILVCLMVCLSAFAESGHKGGGMDVLNEGIAYLNGEGVEQDYEKAMEVFLSAQKSGNRKAARYIGMMYEQGLGVQQDYEAAASWYAQGVDNGDLTSSYYLGMLYKEGKGVNRRNRRA